MGNLLEWLIHCGSGGPTMPISCWKGHNLVVVQSMKLDVLADPVC